jgi:hypothetical protein
MHTVYGIRKVVGRQHRLCLDSPGDLDNDVRLSLSFLLQPRTQVYQVKYAGEELIRVLIAETAWHMQRI